MHPSCRAEEAGGLAQESIHDHPNHLIGEAERGLSLFCHQHWEVDMGSMPNQSLIVKSVLDEQIL